MKKIRKDNLDKIYGGTTVSSAIINAFTNVIKLLMDSGHTLGSAIRRISEKQICPLE